MSIRRRGVAAATWIFLGVAVTLAYAAGPQAALSYRGPELGRLAEDVARAEREVGRAQLGLTGALEVEPTVDYASEDLDSPAELDLGVEVGVEVGYRYDQPALLLRTRDLFSAREAYADAQRDGVWGALLAHVNAFQTRFRFALVSQDLEAAERAAGDAEVQRQVGEASDTELALSRLEVKAAQITFERAQQELRDARAAAASFGMRGELTFRPLRFALPEVSAERTFAYQQALLAVRRAELLGLQSSIYGVLEEVEVSAGYEGENFALSGGLSLSDGLPGARVGADYLETDPDVWRVSLGATLRLDDQTVDDFAAAGRAVEEARDVLNETTYEVERDLRELRREAAFAWRDLEFVQEELVLGAQRIEELEVELAALPGQLAALNAQLARAEARLTALEAQLEAATEDGERESLSEAIRSAQGEITDLGTAIREAEGDLAATERDLEATRAERDGDQDELYDAWRVYLTLVHSYLTLADKGWAVQP